MTFQELGDILRQERLQRGLSMEEVMHETKVSRRHLEAIEDGRVEDLPHPVYVKGFVKIYARMLGVDLKGIGVSVDQAFASVIEEEHQEERRRSRLKKDIPLHVGSRKRGVPGIVILLLVVLLLGGAGYGVWYFFFQPDTQSTEVLPPVEGEGPASDAEIPAVVETTPAPARESSQQGGDMSATLPATLEDEPLPSSAPEGSSILRPEQPELPGQPAVPGQPPIPEEALPQEAQEPIEGEANQPPAAEGQSALVQDGDTASQDGGENTEVVVEEALRSLQSEPMVIASAQAQAAEADQVNVLQIVGQGECWIEAKVDRDFTTDFYVREGELVEIRFTRVLAVKFGNLGEVALRYNGSSYATSVPPSGVKTLTFPPSP